MLNRQQQPAWPLQRLDVEHARRNHPRQTELMSPKKNPIRCLLLSSTPENADEIKIAQALKGAAKEVGVQLVTPAETTLVSAFLTDYALRSSLRSELVRCDLIFAVVSDPSANVFYEIGLAHALGKPVVLLHNTERGPDISSRLFQSFIVPYTNLAPKKLRADFKRVIEQFRKNPNTFTSASLSLGASAPSVDLRRLEPREFENLCFELLTQMGFQRVEWGKELPDIDVVATLAKRDPDGFEYRELWLISLGLHTPPKVLFDMLSEPEHFVGRFLRRSMLTEDTRFISSENPATILLILPPEFGTHEAVEHQLSLIESRIFSKRHKPSIRLRVWDHQHLTSLIQQYPQIAYKYFSEEGRSQSGYRKNIDELYRETVELNEILQATNIELKEEKEKRAKAERDAVWKEVAFKAAHKLGNPVFALETDLQGLKRRIHENPEAALAVAREMGISIEKAKVIIGQFKSLIRAQESSPRDVDVIPLLDSSARVARERGVSVKIDGLAQATAFVDPARITECFDELFANSLRWLDKKQKEIAITVAALDPEDMPTALDNSCRYIRIGFADNGRGVPLEEKDKIFAPFYTTDSHGTGLGLSMVQRVVEGAGGLIRENGTNGEGVHFEIFLPQPNKGVKEGKDG